MAAAAAPGAEDGIRLFLNMAFHQTQTWARDGAGGRPGPMPAGLARKWIEASAAGQGDAAVLLGGRWDAASVWAAVERARQEDAGVAAYLEGRRHRL